MNKSIEVSISSNYSTLNELTPETKNIWLVCHGYGQLSEYFIKNFECLNREENFIIAPQALSKFYLGGFSGKVGACWMTKYNREVEIDNYIKLLSAIYLQETAGVNSSKYRIILLGFSQGTATIARWALKSGISFDALILWAGNFPHDVDHKEAAQMLRNKDFRLTIGTKDQFFNKHQIKEHILHLTNQGLSPKVSTFEGEHKIYDEALLGMGF